MWGFVLKMSLFYGGKRGVKESKNKTKTTSAQTKTNVKLCLLTCQARGYIPVREIHQVVL